MTIKQKEKIGKNSKNIACDGRYFIYCKNIETGEIVSDVNMVELANKMQFNVVAIRTAKCKKRIYKSKYIFANSMLEILMLEKELENINYCSKYDPTISHDEMYLEYYKYILTLEHPTIQQISKDLGLTKAAINKRNKKLKDMGYILPQSLLRNKIKHIELIDTVSNNIECLQLQDIAAKFNISIESARKQIKRTNLYKKTI